VDNTNMGIHLYSHELEDARIIFKSGDKEMICAIREFTTQDCGRIFIKLFTRHVSNIMGIDTAPNYLILKHKDKELDRINCTLQNPHKSRMIQSKDNAKCANIKPVVTKDGNIRSIIYLCRYDNAIVHRVKPPMTEDNKQIRLLGTKSSYRTSHYKDKLRIVKNLIYISHGKTVPTKDIYCTLRVYSSIKNDEYKYRGFARVKLDKNNWTTIGDVCYNAVKSIDYKEKIMSIYILRANLLLRDRGRVYIEEDIHRTYNIDKCYICNQSSKYIFSRYTNEYVNDQIDILIEKGYATNTEQAKLIAQSIRGKLK
jgi:hypothetical protein